MKETVNNIKLALIWGGVLFVVLMVFVLLGGIKREGKKDETWLVEAQVVKKSTTTREDGDKGGEKVYLIGCEDKDGVMQTFEVTDQSLDGKFDGAEVFRELKTGKAYQFKVGWRGREVMNRAGYYPSIYGAAILSDFSPEGSGESGRETKGEGKEASATEKDGTESARADETGNRSESKTKAEDAGKAGAGGETKGSEAARKRSGQAGSGDGTAPTGLEIGGIKIEVVEETVDKELRESIEEQAKSEAAESFDAEKQALEAEIASLKAKLEESPAQ